jgi:hypothetical protein
VFIEILDKIFCQRIILHHAVGTVGLFQHLQLPEHQTFVLATTEQQPNGSYEYQYVT